ncbi:MAG: hypothetical protein F6K30_17660, partial [Cyanothece sp. SIO2G6]|nr:hypothetical protein [Cyanothece sp. SIO2G6]
RDSKNVDIYASTSLAKFLYTQKGASSIATIVKYQHKIVEFPGIYEDKWGTWLSAFAPLEDRNGKVVAVLGLDLEADHVFTLQRTIRHNILIAFLVTQGSFCLVYLTLWKRVQNF